MAEIVMWIKFKAMRAARSRAASSSAAMRSLRRCLLSASVMVATGSLCAGADGGAAAADIDLSDISFGATTTFGQQCTGGTLTVGDGLQAQSLALLDQFRPGTRHCRRHHTG